MNIFRILGRLVVAAVFIFSIGAVLFLAYTLKLRTEYKETATQINEVAAAYQDRAVIQQGDKRISGTSAIVNFYDQFLLDKSTLVYKKASAELTDRTILLEFGEKSLALTGLEDDNSINIRWKTPEKEKSFCVRSEITFTQLEAYLSHYL